MPRTRTLQVLCDSVRMRVFHASAQGAVFRTGRVAKPTPPQGSDQHRDRARARGSGSAWSQAAARVPEHSPRLRLAAPQGLLDSQVSAPRLSGGACSLSAAAVSEGPPCPALSHRRRRHSPPSPLSDPPSQARLRLSESQPQSESDMAFLSTACGAHSGSCAASLRVQPRRRVQTAARTVA